MCGVGRRFFVSKVPTLVTAVTFIEARVSRAAFHGGQAANCMIPLRGLRGISAVHNSRLITSAVARSLPGLYTDVAWTARRILNMAAVRHLRGEVPRCRDDDASSTRRPAVSISSALLARYTLSTSGCALTGL